mmetsp:Transcript_48686/g.136159  ORF Transcript_48686/g.136159 Transcript_48686/m.136159 type:complete len:101 (-) Transcript_48686:990-1292(-)
MKNIANKVPGNNTAVSIVQRCHCLPLKVLYSLAEVNPAKDPISTNNSSIPIIMEPLFAGDKNPIAEKRTRKKAQITSCIPVPTKTQKSMGKATGGRNTSA